MDAASRKAEIVARMQAQREAWQAGREARRAGSDHVEGEEGRAGVGPDSAQAAEPTDSAETAPRSSTLAALMGNPLVRTVADHPLAAAGVVGVLLMLGPRRLLRLSAWVLPLFLRR